MKSVNHQEISIFEFGFIISSGSSRKIAIEVNAYIRDINGESLQTTISDLIKFCDSVGRWLKSSFVLQYFGLLTSVVSLHVVRSHLKKCTSRQSHITSEGNLNVDEENNKQNTKHHERSFVWDWARNPDL